MSDFATLANRYIIPYKKRIVMCKNKGYKVDESGKPYIMVNGRKSYLEKLGFADPYVPGCAEEDGPDFLIDEGGKPYIDFDGTKCYIKDKYLIDEEGKPYLVLKDRKLFGKFVTHVSFSPTQIDSG